MHVVPVKRTYTYSNVNSLWLSRFEKTMDLIFITLTVFKVSFPRTFVKYCLKKNIFKCIKLLHDKHGLHCTN